MMKLERRKVWRFVTDDRLMALCGGVTTRDGRPINPRPTRLPQCRSNNGLTSGQ